MSKNSSKASNRETILTYEELYIVLIQVETILNSHHIPAAERVGANIHYIIISIIFIIGKLIQNLFYHI